MRNIGASFALGAQLSVGLNGLVGYFWQNADNAKEREGQVAPWAHWPYG
jgi:hypothetical protein